MPWMPSALAAAALPDVVYEHRVARGQAMARQQDLEDARIGLITRS
jgi:hypothetical protein